MGPIAKRLAKHLKRGGETKALGAWCRRPERIDDLSSLPAEQRAWMRDFATLMSLSYAVLDRAPLADAKARFEAWDFEYSPGGPPSSPVLDSFFMALQACDFDLGKGETLSTIAVDLAPLLGLKSLQASFRGLARSYRGVFVVRGDRSGRVELEELVTGATYEVAVGDPVPCSPGTLWWTRLLPPKKPTDVWTVLGTPYLLAGPRAQADWSAYFERVLADVSAEHRTRAYVDHMKWGPSASSWLDYVMDGYAGADDVTVHLTGVPDRSETLPHADRASEPRDVEGPAFERLRHRLLLEASRTGALDAAIEQVATFCGGEDRIPKGPTGDLHPLVYAFATLGLRDDGGETVLDLVRAHAPLAPDEAEVADALRAGCFSVFEVLEIEIDARIELRDVLRRRRFWVTERAGTRGVSPGDLLAGWIRVEGDEASFEGALAHIPRQRAEPYREAMRGARDLYKREHPSLSSPQRQGLLVPAALAALAQLRGPPAGLEVRTGDGEPLLFSEARFDIEDAVEVIARLAVTDLEPVEPKVWHRVSSSGVLESRIEIDGASLLATARSKAGLERVKAWLQSELGGLVRHRLDSFEDVLSEAAATAPPRPDGPVPPQLRAALRSMLEAHLERWVDEPVPLLDGKTPRQAVRTKKGKNAVTALLLEQERALADHPQLEEPVDMRSVWAELGLTHPDDPR